MSRPSNDSLPRRSTTPVTSARNPANEAGHRAPSPTSTPGTRGLLNHQPMTSTPRAAPSQQQRTPVMGSNIATSGSGETSGRVAKLPGTNGSPIRASGSSSSTNGIANGNGRFVTSLPDARTANPNAQASRPETGPSLGYQDTLRRTQAPRNSSRPRVSAGTAVSTPSTSTRAPARPNPAEAAEGSITASTSTPALVPARTVTPVTTPAISRQNGKRPANRTPDNGSARKRPRTSVIPSEIIVMSSSSEDESSKSTRIATQRQKRRRPADTDDSEIEYIADPPTSARKTPGKRPDKSTGQGSLTPDSSNQSRDSSISSVIVAAPSEPPRKSAVPASKPPRPTSTSDPASTANAATPRGRETIRSAAPLAVRSNGILATTPTTHTKEPIPRASPTNPSLVTPSKPSPAASRLVVQTASSTRVDATSASSTSVIAQASVPSREPTQVSVTTANRVSSTSQSRPPTASLQSLASPSSSAPSAQSPAGIRKTTQTAQGASTVLQPVSGPSRLATSADGPIPVATQARISSANSDKPSSKAAPTSRPVPASSRSAAVSSVPTQEGGTRTQQPVPRPDRPAQISTTSAQPITGPSQPVASTRIPGKVPTGSASIAAPETQAVTALSNSQSNQKAPSSSQPIPSSGRSVVPPASSTPTVAVPPTTPATNTPVAPVISTTKQPALVDAASKPSTSAQTVATAPSPSLSQPNNNNASTSKPGTEAKAPSRLRPTQTSLMPGQAVPSSPRSTDLPATKSHPMPALPATAPSTNTSASASSQSRPTQRPPTPSQAGPSVSRPNSIPSEEFTKAPGRPAPSVVAKSQASAPSTGQAGLPTPTSAGLVSAPPRATTTPSASVTQAAHRPTSARTDPPTSARVILPSQAAPTSVQPVTTTSVPKVASSRSSNQQTASGPPAPTSRAPAPAASSSQSSRTASTSAQPVPAPRMTAVQSPIPTASPNSSRPGASIPRTVTTALDTFATREESRLMINAAARRIVNGIDDTRGLAQTKDKRESSSAATPAPANSLPVKQSKPRASTSKRTVSRSIKHPADATARSPAVNKPPAQTAASAAQPVVVRSPADQASVTPKSSSAVPVPGRKTDASTVGLVASTSVAKPAPTKPAQQSSSDTPIPAKCRPAAKSTKAPAVSTQSVSAKRPAAPVGRAAPTAGPHPSTAQSTPSGASVETAAAVQKLPAQITTTNYPVPPHAVNLPSVDDSGFSAVHALIQAAERPVTPQDASLAAGVPGSTAIRQSSPRIGVTSEKFMIAESKRLLLARAAARLRDRSSGKPDDHSKSTAASASAATSFPGPPVPAAVNETTVRAPASRPTLSTVTAPPAPTTSSSSSRPVPVASTITSTTTAGANPPSKASSTPKSPLATTSRPSSSQSRRSASAKTPASKAPVSKAGAAPSVPASLATTAPQPSAVSKKTSEVLGATATVQLSSNTVTSQLSSALAAGPSGAQTLSLRRAAKSLVVATATKNPAVASPLSSAASVPRRTSSPIAAIRTARVDGTSTTPSGTPPRHLSMMDLPGSHANSPVPERTWLTFGTSGLRTANDSPEKDSGDDEEMAASSNFGGRSEARSRVLSDDDDNHSDGPAPSSDLGDRGESLLEAAHSLAQFASTTSVAIEESEDVQQQPTSHGLDGEADPLASSSDVTPTRSPQPSILSSAPLTGGSALKTDTPVLIPRKTTSAARSNSVTTPLEAKRPTTLALGSKETRLKEKSPWKVDFREERAVSDAVAPPKAVNDFKMTSVKYDMAEKEDDRRWKSRKRGRFPTGWRSTYNPEYALLLLQIRARRSTSIARAKATRLPFLKRNLKSGIRSVAARAFPRLPRSARVKESLDAQFKVEASLPRHVPGHSSLDQATLLSTRERTADHHERIQSVQSREDSIKQSLIPQTFVLRLESIGCVRRSGRSDTICVPLDDLNSTLPGSARLRFSIDGDRIHTQVITFASHKTMSSRRESSGGEDLRWIDVEPPVEIRLPSESFRSIGDELALDMELAHLVDVDGDLWPPFVDAWRGGVYQHKLRLVQSSKRLHFDVRVLNFRHDNGANPTGISMRCQVKWEFDYRLPMGKPSIELRRPREPANVKISYTSLASVRRLKRALSLQKAEGDRPGGPLSGLSSLYRAWSDVPLGWVCLYCDLGDLGGEEELAAHYKISHSDDCHVECTGRDTVDGILQVHLRVLTGEAMIYAAEASSAVTTSDAQSTQVAVDASAPTAVSSRIAASSAGDTTTVETLSQIPSAVLPTAAAAAPSTPLPMKKGSTDPPLSRKTVTSTASAQFDVEVAHNIISAAESQAAFATTPSKRVKASEKKRSSLAEKKAAAKAISSSLADARTAQAKISQTVVHGPTIPEESNAPQSGNANSKSSQPSASGSRISAGERSVQKTETRIATGVALEKGTATKAKASSSTLSVSTATTPAKSLDPVEPAARLAVDKPVTQSTDNAKSAPGRTSPSGISQKTAEKHVASSVLGSEESASDTYVAEVSPEPAQATPRVHRAEHRADPYAGASRSEAPYQEDVTMHEKVSDASTPPSVTTTATSATFPDKISVSKPSDNVNVDSVSVGAQLATSAKVSRKSVTIVADAVSTTASPMDIDTPPVVAMNSQKNPKTDAKRRRELMDQLYGADSDSEGSPSPSPMPQHLAQVMPNHSIAVDPAAIEPVHVEPVDVEAVDVEPVDVEPVDVEPVIDHPMEDYHMDDYHMDDYHMDDYNAPSPGNYQPNGSTYGKKSLRPWEEDETVDAHTLFEHDNPLGIMQPQMKNRRNNEFTTWSSRVVPGTAMDLMPELDKLWDGGKYRYGMRLVEEKWIATWYHISEKRRFFCCTWHRWRDEKGPMKMNNTDAYLKGWVDKYGEVLLRAGLDEQIIDHFIFLRREKQIPADVLRMIVQYWHDFCQAVRRAKGEVTEEDLWEQKRQGLKGKGKQRHLGPVGS